MAEYRYIPTGSDVTYKFSERELPQIFSGGKIATRKYEFDENDITIPEGGTNNVINAFDIAWNASLSSGLNVKSTHDLLSYIDKFNLMAESGGVNGLPVYTEHYVDNVGRDNIVGNYITVPDDLDPDKSVSDPIQYTSDGNGTYMDIMFSAIRSLQNEVARLRNSFKMGIYSYTGTETYMSNKVGEDDTLPENEPLWAISEAELSDIDGFDCPLTTSHKFEPVANVTVGEDMLTFGGEATWTDDGSVKDVEDTKLFLYITATSPNIKINITKLPSKDNDGNVIEDGGEPVVKTIDLSKIRIPRTVNDKYNILLILSRSIFYKKNADTTKTWYGDNFVWLSVADYLTGEASVEGWLNFNSSNIVVQNNVYKLGTKDHTANDKGSNRYYISSVTMEDLDLTKFDMYSRYQNFINSVEPTVPTTDDLKYRVAHITIRSCKNYVEMNSIKHELPNNELIFDESTKALYIKSNDKLIKIGTGGSDTPDIPDDTDDMTQTEVNELIAAAFNEMGIVSNENGNMELNPVEKITFVNNETNKKFDVTVDAYGNLNSNEQDDSKTLAGLIEEAQFTPSEDFDNFRGFVAQLRLKQSGNSSMIKTGDIGLMADRVKIASVYAPTEAAAKKAYGCSHAFVELENTSDKDFPLDGCYLHYSRPTDRDNTSFVVYHLALKGRVPAGSTYLIRGKQYAPLNDANTFIKVTTYDQEWYDESGDLIDFTMYDESDRSANICPYGFALTYGLADLSNTTQLYMKNPGSDGKGIHGSKTSSAPYVFKAGFIDAIYINVAAKNKEWTIGANPVNNKYPNCIYKNTFELDPAKQAFNGLTTYDSSRQRCDKPANDFQQVNLDKPYISFPKTDEIYPVSKYTPKASFEHKNVITDKNSIREDKPNMVTVSFGLDAYTTRCFNWISVGTFDEYVWIKKEDDTKWNKFESYKNIPAEIAEGTSYPHRVEFPVDVNNIVYAHKERNRLWGRFPGNNVLFTSHKCIVDIVADAPSVPTKYVYKVGRADKNGNPDPNYISKEMSFTLYPKTYVPKIYQITDQQGFHWIEYQVWAGVALTLNDKIEFDKKYIMKSKDVTLTEAHTLDENSKLGATDIFGYIEATATGYADKVYINESGKVMYYNADGKMTTVSDPVELSDTTLFYYAVRTDSDEQIIPVLLNTGDMTQSGSRINEWLDYYNAGEVLFDHLEQVNLVGNNDLCNTDPENLGTGDDTGKSNSFYFHIFYCYEVPATQVTLRGSEETVYPIANGKYIPSQYYIDFATQDKTYRIIMMNSEITTINCKDWFNLNYVQDGTSYPVNIYTGFTLTGTAATEKYVGNEIDDFTPIYTLLFNWTKDPSIIYLVACHEMPYTVITNESITKNISGTDAKTFFRSISNAKKLVGSHLNQINENEQGAGIYWFSRLLEWRGIHLCIGGHKHTYTCTYPVAEYFKFTKDGVEYNSKDNYNEFEMFETLANEEATTSEGIVVRPIKWQWKDENDVDYNFTKFPLTLRNDVSTGTESVFYPYTHVENLPQAVTYFMCQASGYKLTSNKELPSAVQKFSKILPKTINAGSDSPSGEQKYPMFSEVSFTSTGYKIILARVANIMTAGSFTAYKFSTDPIQIQYFNNVLENDLTNDNPYGVWYPIVEKPCVSVPYSYQQPLEH